MGTAKLCTSGSAKVVVACVGLAKNKQTFGSTMFHQSAIVVMVCIGLAITPPPPGTV